MTKAVVKFSQPEEIEQRSGSPIHLHISDDTPIHLHIDRSQQLIKNSTDVSDARERENKVIYQAPWVPPPAKTSSGRALFGGKGGKRAGKKNIHAFVTDDEIGNQPNKENAIDTDVCTSSEVGPKTNPKELTLTMADKPCTSPEARNETVARAHDETVDESVDHVRNKELGGGADTSWVDGRCILNKWTKDMEVSIDRLCKSAQDLVHLVGEVMYSSTNNNQGITANDVYQLNNMRDDIILQADITANAVHEIGLWAASCATQECQSDGYHVQQLSKSQAREASLIAEVRQLTENLAERIVALDVAQKQLAQKESESIKFNTIHDSLESVRSHLQRELRQREADCNRLNVQIRNLEKRLVEERTTLRGQLGNAENELENLRGIKVALKTAARAQKRRAERAEQALTEALERLAVKESVVLGDPYQAELPTCGGGNWNIPPVVEFEKAATTGSHRSTDSSPKHDSRNKEDYHRRTKKSGEHSRHPSDENGDKLVIAETEIECLRTGMARYESILNRYCDDATKQAAKLQMVTDKLKKSEEDQIDCRKQLLEIELRLRESEHKNRLLTEQLGHGGNGLQATSLVTPPMMTHSQQLNGRSPPVKHQTESNGPPKEIIYESDKLAYKSDGSSELVDELRRELSEACAKRELAERKAQMQVNDLQKQLIHADVTNKSLQAYLTFLKRSYSSVFHTELDIQNGDGIDFMNPDAKLIAQQIKPLTQPTILPGLNGNDNLVST